MEVLAWLETFLHCAFTKTNFPCLECGGVIRKAFFHGKWHLGHFSKMCGPIISHWNWNEVVKKYNELKEQSTWKEESDTQSTK